MDWINAAAQGVLLGGFYALLASGLSFLFGVMRIANLAHGASVVLSAYLALWVLELTGVPWFVTLVVVVPLIAALGWVLQLSVLNRALERGGLAPILVTFGLAVALSSLIQELFSADSRSIPAPGLGEASIAVAPGLAIGVLPLLTFGIGILVIVVLQLFLARTRLGRAIRAASDDASAAQLMGIDTKRIFALAAALAMATVGVAGVVLGLRTQFTPVYGNLVLIFAFEAVIIGGLGSLWGTLAGGLILGLAQTIGAQLFPGYGVLIGHLVFLVLLAARPSGLLPKAVTA
jgi:branched-chain amino acid transport system permease protein